MIVDVGCLARQVRCYESVVSLRARVSVGLRYTYNEEQAVSIKPGGNIIDCLSCGMRVPRDVGRCPKCDGQVARQTDGYVLTEDIAHQQERVHEALIKLERLLIEAEVGRAAGLRVIVGSGLIREAVFAELRARQFSGDILSYSQDGQNSGAVFVKLR